jgi:hypothetical protein
VKPREAGPHIVQFFAEVAGQVAQLRQVGAVFVRVFQWLARDGHDVGPERAVRIDGLLVVAEALRCDEGGDLRAVHGIVDALRRRQVGRADAVQPAQHALPHRAARGLGARVDLRQRVLHVARFVLVPREPLLDAPLPLGPVDGLEALVGLVRRPGGGGRGRGAGRGRERDRQGEGKGGGKHGLLHGGPVVEVVGRDMVLPLHTILPGRPGRRQSCASFAPLRPLNRSRRAACQDCASLTAPRRAPMSP